MTGSIIIVKSDTADTDRIEKQLRADGHNVNIVTDRTELLQLLEDKTCDLVILEVAPPSLEGFELMNLIQKHTDPVPVIALVHETKKSLIAQITRYGGYDFLHTPEDLDIRMDAAVKRALEHRKTVRDNRTLTEECSRLQAESDRTEKADDLTQRISHDFRNVLSVLMGYTTLIHMKIEQDHPVVPYMEQIQETLERALALTHEITFVARKETLVLEWMALHDVINTLHPMMQQTLHERITFQVDLKAEIDHVLMDRTQLEQVIMNLVTNARDAMAEGGRLTLQTELMEIEKDIPRPPGLPDGIFIHLAIGDTGHGMDKDTQDRIFEKYFTTKQKDKGTGIGLATVHDIVTQNGGVITVSSEPGVGTTFSVYLPVLKKTSPA